MCLPEKTAGKDITSQPGSARMAANRREAARKVRAPVAAGPPYPKKNTARKGPKARMAPTTGLIFGVNFTITKCNSRYNNTRPMAQASLITTPSQVTSRYTGQTSVIKNSPRPNRNMRPIKSGLMVSPHWFVISKTFFVMCKVHCPILIILFTPKTTHRFLQPLSIYYIRTKIN